MDSVPTYCLFCRCIFVASEENPALPRTATCPDCGAAELRSGHRTRDQLEWEHLLRFGGSILLMEALAVAGVKVHAMGRGMCWSGFESLLEADTVVVVVGRRSALVLLDSPRAAGASWRIRVPVRVTGTGKNAGRGVLRTVQDTMLAPGLLAEGFVHQALADPVAANGVYRAVWSRTTGNSAAAAAFVHAVGGVNTTADADDFRSELTVGDWRENATAASHLPDGVCVTQLTPWGVSLVAADRRELGCIDGEGRGRIYVYLVLPDGFSARAAARRRDVGLLWFQDNLEETWREHGFSDARAEGSGSLGSGKHLRRAVRLVIRFTVNEAAEKRLAWAADNGVIEFAGDGPLSNELRDRLRATEHAPCPA